MKNVVFRDIKPQIILHGRHIMSLLQSQFVEGYKSRSSSSCSFLHLPVTASLIGPNILLSRLFSNILSLCSSLNVRDHVSHQYRTAGKIVFLNILTFIFFDYRREDRRFWIEW
jgi:hypothetical protein